MNTKNVRAENCYSWALHVELVIPDGEDKCIVCYASGLKMKCNLSAAKTRAFIDDDLRKESIFLIDYFLGELLALLERNTVVIPGRES